MHREILRLSITSKQIFTEVDRKFKAANFLVSATRRM